MVALVYLLELYVQGRGALHLPVMRHALPLLLAAAAVSAQTVNTQVDGIVLTNGLSSLSDTSAINSGANTSYGITYLTDGDTSTFTTNIGEAFNSILGNDGIIRGTFAGTPSSQSTGVFIVGSASSAIYTNYVTSTRHGSFSVQLDLKSGLTAAQTYADADFVITTQLISTYTGYSNFNDALGSLQVTLASNVRYYYSYLFIPYADFNTTFDQVVGIKIADMTAEFPDFSYISAGYAGAYTPGPVVPEPSTYGLMLGGLALAGAALRRRRRA